MKTLFSFEVPIAHLNDFEDLQDFHFSLSFLYDDPKYKAFMMRQASRGYKPVWLDNSYNEKLEAESSHKLVALMREVGAAKIIAPDDPKWPMAKILESVKDVARSVPMDNIIAVVSSMEMFQELRSFGITHFAHSYWNRYPNRPPLWLQDIQEDYRECDLHFLGLANTSDLVPIKPISCDTSMPIKLAMQHKSVDTWINEGCPHIYTHELPFFFHMCMTSAEVDLARLNISHIKEIANG